jgi:hypothetical protein
MGLFIRAATRLSSCNTLGDQVRVYALRRGCGWETIRNDLAALAEEWFGREPAKSRRDFRLVCAEVFRVD